MAKPCIQLMLKFSVTHIKFLSLVFSTQLQRANHCLLETKKDLAYHSIF